MRITTILRFLQKGNKEWYDFDIDEALAYVKSFNEPTSLWQRSFFQYKCHRYGAPKWKRPLLNIGAAFLLPFVLIALRLFHIGVRFLKKEDCVSECYDAIPMIPDSLKQEYIFNFDAYSAGFSISHKDFVYFIVHAKTYFSDPSFLLHALFKLAQYSNIIIKYSPNVIVSENEYAFCSSLLTDYCRHCKVKHINMMHGERLMHIRNSFFAFDKCYVWHEHYKQLYIDLRADPNQFIIEIPPGLRIDVEESFDPSKYATYKYYLQRPSLMELKDIIASLRPLKEAGFSIKYRPHPIFTDISMLNELLSPDDIEQPSDVDARVSVASTDYAIGSYSTVLLQAYLCGKGVLIDDITYKDRIGLHKKAKHIIMSVDGPELLSCHINKKCTLQAN